MNKIALLILCTLLCRINIAEAYVIDADWDKVEKSSSQEDNILDSFWWSSATLQIVQEKIQAGLDVNKSDLNGNTLLMLATLAKAKPDIVEKLINAGADINVQNNIGNTPLILATSNNNEELVKLFIKKNADLHIENDDGKTAFVYAYYNRNVNIFDILLNAGAKIEEINKHIGHDTVLTHVLADNNCSTQFIEAILRTNPDVNKIVNNKTPLMLAINRDTGWQVKSTTTFETMVPVVSGRYYERRQYKDEINLTNAFIQPNLKNDHRIPLINKLLEYGADVNQKVISKDNKTGNTIEQTALSHAVCNKQSAKLIKQLDNAGARDANALYCAILHNYDGDIIQSLLKPNLKPQQGLDLSLIEAVKQKKITLVKQLIQNGANVNGYDKEGKTALTHASPTIAKILKENGAFDSMDIFTAIDDNDLTKLESLIKAGAKLDIVKILNQNEKQEIRKVFYDINEVKGLTPLEYAAFTNKPQVVRLLIQNGSNVNERINKNDRYPTLFDYFFRYTFKFNFKLREVLAVFLEAPNVDKEKYLWEALYNQDYKLLQMLINAGADVNATNENNETLSQELITRIYSDVKNCRNNEEIQIYDNKWETFVKIFIGAGADFSKKNKNGKTPLEIAMNNKLETVSVALIEAGVDINTKKNGETLLEIAINNKLEKVSVALIEAGIDINTKNKNGETLLEIAINKNLETVSVALIEAGADVNTKDKYGCSPLLKAVTYGLETVALALIEAGADVKVNGLIYAAINHKLEFTAITLIKAGAEFDYKDNLVQAIRKELEYTTLALIKAGIDVNQKGFDEGGFPVYPLDAAVEHKLENVIPALLNAGAKPHYLSADEIAWIEETMKKKKEKTTTETVKIYKEHEVRCQDGYCFSPDGNPVNGVLKLYRDDTYVRQLTQETMFKAGKKDGIEKIYYNNDQLKSEAIFKNGEKDGIEKLYYINGNLQQEVLFKNGIPDGIAKVYYKDGILKSEIEYKNGELITEKEFDENGQLKLEHIYYENGQIKRTQAYLNGKPALAKEYYENGQVKVEPIFKNGKLEVKEYYENGQVKVEASVEDGELDGMVKEYYENGQLKSEAIFDNGKPNGVLKEYYENGQKKSEATFQKGNLITKKEFDENGQLKQ